MWRIGVAIGPRRGRILLSARRCGNGEWMKRHLRRVKFDIRGMKNGGHAPRRRAKHVHDLSTRRGALEASGRQLVWRLAAE
jgi:hypothetical protein